MMAHLVKALAIKSVDLHLIHGTQRERESAGTSCPLTSDMCGSTYEQISKYEIYRLFKETSVFSFRREEDEDEHQGC